MEEVTYVADGTGDNGKLYPLPDIETVDDGEELLGWIWDVQGGIDASPPINVVDVEHDFLVDRVL